MVNVVSFLLTGVFAARVGATRQLSVDSLGPEMIQLESLAESHHTDQIHQILGHHHDAKADRNEMLESVLQTGVFPKSKHGQDQTTDELVKDYLDKGYIFPKGRRKYGNILSPNTVSQSNSKEDKKKTVWIENGTAGHDEGEAAELPSSSTDPNTSSPVNSTTASSGLDNATVRVVAQSIPVSAFVYESRSTLSLNDDGLDIVATVTNSVLMDIFTDFYQATPNVDFLSAETSGYRSLGHNLFRFDSTVLFNGGFAVPSEEELQDVVDHGFAPGASAAIFYMDRLHSTGDPRLADIEGISFIGSEVEIQTLSAAAKEQETKGNVKVSVPTLHQTPENEVESVHNFDLLFLRTILVVSMVFFTIFLVYMEARRQNVLLGRNLEENIMKPRTENDEPTYRADLFSKGARRNDIESYDEVSIGDDSYSMNSEASTSPPTSPFRSELCMALRRQAEGSPTKPAWATRNRTPNPNSATKPHIQEDSQVQGTDSTEASFPDEASEGEDADIIEIGSLSENHFTEEGEHVLSIPMLKTTNEYIVDNQDLASNSSTDYSVPGQESLTVRSDDPKHAENSASAADPDRTDQEKTDEEKPIPVQKDSKEPPYATEETKKPTSTVKTDWTGPASGTDQQNNANSASVQPNSGQPIVSDVPPQDVVAHLSEEQSSEPEWMKKFKRMGLDRP